MTKRVLLISTLGLVITAVALTASTQYVAGQLRYHRQLGSPLAQIGRVSIYPPWAWLAWDERLHRLAPRLFATASLITYGTLAVGPGPILAFPLLARPDPPA